MLLCLYALQFCIWRIFSGFFLSPGAVIVVFGLVFVAGVEFEVVAVEAASSAEVVFVFVVTENVFVSVVALPRTICSSDRCCLLNRCWKYELPPKFPPLPWVNPLPRFLPCAPLCCTGRSPRNALRNTVFAACWACPSYAPRIFCGSPSSLSISLWKLGHALRRCGHRL